MQKTKLIIFLFIGLTPSFTQLGIALQQENGEAIIVNKCGVPIYYISINNSSSFRTLSSNAVYQEQFRLKYLREDKYSGISIMLSLNQTITAAVNKQQAFFQSTITQFKYIYYLLKPLRLQYNILNVNGYVYNIDNGWNGIWPQPFQEDGLIVKGISKECTTIVCPSDNSNSNSTCIQAYTHFKDDQATYGYRNNNFIVLILCIKRYINSSGRNNTFDKHSCY